MIQNSRSFRWVMFPVRIPDSGDDLEILNFGDFCL